MIKPLVKNYTKYYQGNIPLILSAPHGGDIKPEELKTRKTGVFDKDDYTYELIELIIEEFYSKTNLIPYGVIAEISREKVDLNRKRSEAYEDEDTKVVYDTFHNFIEDSRKEIEKKFGKGLYIDIHGQSHPKTYLEFGYLLDNEVLRLHESELREYQEKSSIKTLSEFSQECFIDQLRGPHSMGSLMCNQGYDSVPSVKLPYASDGNYFEGAYDTIQYGSLDGRTTSGIQIEFPYIGCRDTHENRKACAKAFVNAILKFMEIHLKIDFEKVD